MALVIDKVHHLLPCKVVESFVPIHTHMARLSAQRNLVTVFSSFEHTLGLHVPWPGQRPAVFVPGLKYSSYTSFCRPRVFSVPPIILSLNSLWYIERSQK